MGMCVNVWVAGPTFIPLNMDVIQYLLTNIPGGVAHLPEKDAGWDAIDIWGKHSLGATSWYDIMGREMMDAD